LSGRSGGGGGGGQDNGGGDGEGDGECDGNKDKISEDPSPIGLLRWPPSAASRLGLSRTVEVICSLREKKKNGVRCDRSKAVAAAVAVAVAVAAKFFRSKL
jgi:hypothetical protein